MCASTHSHTHTHVYIQMREWTWNGHWPTWVGLNVLTTHKSKWDQTNAKTKEFHSSTKKLTKNEGKTKPAVDDCETRFSLVDHIEWILNYFMTTTTTMRMKAIVATTVIIHIIKVRTLEKCHPNFYNCK